MAGLNKVMLIGNVGKDPEIKHLEGGSAVAKFSLATSESRKDKSGNRVEQTEWHNIVIWNRGEYKAAEIAEKYIKKGSQLFVEGKIRSHQYEDKDKIKRYSFEIVADNFTLLGRKPEDANANSGASADFPKINQETPSVASEPEVGDDLPF